MNLSQLKDRIIVNINNGEKLGILGNCDLQIDEKEGKIEAVLIPQGKARTFFSGEIQYLTIPWESIVKIGMDTIMIDIKK
ncbi:YlmC/YmxH family sporulation protein [Anaerofustis sp.]|uniref:YlmC/YmxH family sporulation protein n=1 Tax=Anaerofustis sp. TaxID=1872517 RepID=UPI0025B81D11|nr:YlmC/YmxH family sporulation protein [Anaerofustis sp.]